jgi:hypothetical protein
MQMERTAHEQFGSLFYSFSKMSRRFKEQRRLTMIYFHHQGRVDEYTVTEKGRLATPITSGSRRAPPPNREAPMVPHPIAHTFQPESEGETITVLDIDELEPTPIDFRAWEPWNDFELVLSPNRARSYAERQQFLLD